jgi:hypothetical protein
MQRGRSVTAITHVCYKMKKFLTIGKFSKLSNNLTGYFQYLARQFLTIHT